MIAIFYISNLVLQWYTEIHLTFELRFSPSNFFSHKAQLHKLKQQNIIDAYLGEFKSLPTRIIGLNNNNLLNYFLLGLRQDVQRELYILKPSCGYHTHNTLIQIYQIPNNHPIFFTKLTSTKYSKLSLTKSIIEIHRCTTKCLTLTEMAIR